MGLIVTIAIFSGRTDPMIEFDDDTSRQILDYLEPVELVDEYPEPTLGSSYRGITFQQGETGRDPRFPRRFTVLNGVVFGRGISHSTRDAGVEDYLLSTEGPLLPALADLAEEVANASNMTLQEFIKLRREPIPTPDIGTLEPIHLQSVGCTCGPLYEPHWWNQTISQDGIDIQTSNNCYSYASNIRMDLFTVPGNRMVTPLTFSEVQRAALRDGYELAGPRSPDRCPDEGHFVAFALDRFGTDVHFYRKDRSGFWSHKPGSGPATDRDANGARITSPETMHRGEYWRFGSYLIARPGHIRLRWGGP